MSQVRQFADQDVRDDGVKGRAVVNEEHPDVSLRVFPGAQHSVMAIASSVYLFALEANWWGLKEEGRQVLLVDG